MRETAYFCDFSSQVPKHPACFSVRAGKGEGNMVEKDQSTSDCCLTHLSAIVSDQFTILEMERVDVRRIPGTEIVKVEGVGVLRSGAKVRFVCGDCGKGFASYSGIGNHERIHNHTRQSRKGQEESNG